jgi:hypothetical protein
MSTPSFHYTTHPGDLFRNTSVVELPNPETHLEDFLIWFLDCYQTDDRVAYINDLYKLLHNEFRNDEDRIAFMDEIGHLSHSEIQNEIKEVEENLKAEAYENFYCLLRDNKIVLVN